MARRAPAGKEWPPHINAVGTMSVCLSCRRKAKSIAH
jgi:hypothetical protein